MTLAMRMGCGGEATCIGRGGDAARVARGDDGLLPARGGDAAPCAKLEIPT